jgi:hypothetical protein
VPKAVKYTVSRAEQLSGFLDHLHHVLVNVVLGSPDGISIKKKDIHFLPKCVNTS